MIEELTPEQIEAMPRVRDKWIKIGLATGPADRPAAEAATRKAYQLAGKPEPHTVLWVDSPMMGAELAAYAARYADVDELGVMRQADHTLTGAALRSAANDMVRMVMQAIHGHIVARQAAPKGALVLKPSAFLPAGVHSAAFGVAQQQLRAADREPTGSEIANQLYSCGHGQHDAGWLSFYWFFWKECGVEECARLEGLFELAEAAGWLWPLDGVAILTERPSELHLDPQERLHNERGPAFRYPDGFEAYFWHGTSVPAELVTRGWLASEIMQEQNAEIRRCAIERIGWDEFIIQAGLKQVGPTMDDPGNPGNTMALYDIPEAVLSTSVRVLLVTNGSPERDGTRRRFGLTVPADEVSTPLEAQAWMQNDNDHPLSITTEQYAQLNRRS